MTTKAAIITLLWTTQWSQLFVSESACKQQKEDQAVSLNWVMKGAIACSTPSHHLYQHWLIIIPANRKHKENDKYFIFYDIFL